MLFRGIRWKWQVPLTWGGPTLPGSQLHRWDSGHFAVGGFEVQVQWKAEDEDLKLFQVRVEACRFLCAQLDPLGAPDKA